MNKWPWRNKATGILVWPDCWYGFTKFGNICAPYKGCRSSNEAMDWVKDVLDTTPSLNPDDIGVERVVVTTGKQYTERLSMIDKAQFEEFGEFIGD
jgi:hypothetical protein